jgi:hypothetical protein
MFNLALAKNTSVNYFNDIQNNTGVKKTALLVAVTALNINMISRNYPYL